MTTDTTTTVQLTDAQLAQFTACGLIVVDDDSREVIGEMVGDPCEPLVWGPATEGELSSQGVPLPAGWVATCTCGWSSTGHASEQGGEDAATIHAEMAVPMLADVKVGVISAPESWRKLAEPCATCEGDGVVGTDQGWTETCPDCVGGHQVVMLTATCPSCGGNGAADRLFGAHCQTCSYIRPGTARELTSDGKVNIGRFTIRLLPVVDHDVMERHVFVSPCRYAYLVESNEHQPALRLDPLPQPGQWAVRFEAVAP